MSKVKLTRQEFFQKYKIMEEFKNAQKKHVLLLFLEGNTQEQIASKIGRSTSIVRRNISEISKLFLGFSSRDRLVELFYEYKPKLIAHEVLQRHSLVGEPPKPEFPEGPEPLDSPFYLERDIDSNCYENILKDGCLIRIKAPKWMGKTSLMIRIFDYAEQHDYFTVRLNLLEVDRNILSNLDNLCRCFCGNIAEQLNLEYQIDKYWKSYLGSTLNCIKYFEKYIMPEINYPLVLGLDEVDRILFYPKEIYEDFFAMLRSLHEKSKTYELWKKLKLIVTYSTEYHTTLNINQSPFNVGYTVELQEFTKEQTKELVTSYKLDWKDAQIEELMEMVGGHPQLLRIAMYHVIRQDEHLESLLLKAPTNEGVYSYHLLQILENIKQDVHLVANFKEVVTTDTSVELDPITTNKLYSMGLVHKESDKVKLRCNLYRQYFSKFL